jgi:hypothetical protein
MGLWVSWALVVVLAVALIALLSPFAGGLALFAQVAPDAAEIWSLSPALVVCGFAGLLFMLAPFVIVTLVFRETYRSLRSRSQKERATI